MEIVTPEDRVVLWRSTIEAEGRPRRALLHVLAKEVLDGLSDLDLHSDQYAELTVKSLEVLDDGGLLARDSLRLALEGARDEAGGLDVLAVEVAGLLREASGVEHLGVERRVHAVEMAAEWREHVLDRERPESACLSVAEVAARLGVTTQAVYKWLKNDRIQATRGPGGSWRIPAAQFERNDRPASSRERLDRLQAHLVRLHPEDHPASDVELGQRMRPDD
jgi:excisionase family DNA binding protein